MPRPRRYGKVEVEIDRLADDSLEVRAVSSLDQQRARRPFRPPVEIDKTASFLERVEHAIKRSNPELSGGDDDAAEDDFDLRFEGTKLYDALFADTTGELLAESLAWNAALESQGAGAGLRLRLLFDPQLAALAALPWEALYRPRSGAFLGRRAAFPISRAFPGDRSYPLLEVRTPFRMLLLAPNPTLPNGGHRLDLKSEQDAIRRELDRNPAIDVEEVKPPTIDNLARILRRRGPFHALHYMGHASFAPEVGGCFYFESDEGTEVEVFDSVFADHLARQPSLRLVVLNACRSGALPTDSDTDPFTGLATSLLGIGVPAVVANQFTISDRAAIVFARRFYRSIADGEAVDAAAAEGRLAMYTADPYSLEWITPTVFMQVPDGELKIRGGVPVRLGVRSLLPWSNAMERRSKEILNLLDCFDGRRPKSPDTWNHEIAPHLWRFVREHVEQGRPHVLEIPVHASIAFALGNLIEAKSATSVAIRQPSVGSASYWRAEEADPDRGDAPGWQSLDTARLTRGGTDLAVAVSLSQPTVDAARRFAGDDPVRAGFVLHAELAGGASQRTVRDGAHAWALAQDLSRAITAWRGRHGPVPTIHLFLAAPNTFVFFLGQLSRSFGRVQLYEFAFGEADAGTYFPSIQLPIRPPRDERSTSKPPDGSLPEADRESRGGSEP